MWCIKLNVVVLGIITVTDERRVCVFQDVVPKYPTHCEVEWVDAEDPLFLLYTSGSTGKPKVWRMRMHHKITSMIQGCASFTVKQSIFFLFP